MRVLIACVLVALVGSACATDSHSDFVATGNQSTSGGTAVSAGHVEPGGTPSAQDIDEIMSSLEGVRAGVRRDVLATRSFTPESKSRLEAIFTEPALSFQTGVYEELAERGDPVFKANPGDARFPVEELVTASHDCVWFRTHSDESAAVHNPGPSVKADVVLVRAAHDRSINPTPWMIKQFIPAGIIEEANACS